MEGWERKACETDSVCWTGEAYCAGGASCTSMVWCELVSLVRLVGWYGLVRPVRCVGLMGHVGLKGLVRMARLVGWMGLEDW